MIDLGFEGKRVLVSGGSSGIGLAVAEAFLREGAAVGFVGRNEERLAAAEATLRRDFPESELCAVAADVGNETQISKAVEVIANRLGGIDHVVSNAGIPGSLGLPISDVTFEEFIDIQRVNVVGAFLLVKWSLPFLVEASSATVTIIGSDSGFVAVPGMLAYNASKGALVQLTRALAVEFSEPYGIRVNSVCPSATDTPMSRRTLEVDSWDTVGYPVSTPDEIAWLVLSLASHRSRAVNGVSLLADHAYHARSSYPA